MYIHLFLHGKGGIGKSQMAAATGDYLMRHGSDVVCVDCDPSTDTFRRVTSLRVQFFDIMNGDEVDSSKFDEMLMAILDSGAQHAVIDSGSGAYRALVDYLMHSDMLRVLAAEGHPAFLHTVLAGGGQMTTTVDGFHKLVECFPEGDFVVWLNPKEGPLVHQGVHVVQHEDFERYSHLVRSVIEVPQLNKGTFMKDLSRLLAQGQTFADAQADRGTNFIVKNRLRQLQQMFDALLDQALLELGALNIAGGRALSAE